MAATATAAKLSANLAVNTHVGAADITTQTDITFPDITAGSNLWLDMQGFEHVMFIVTLSVLNDNIEAISILSNSGSTGGGTDYTVLTDGTTSVPLTTEANAAGDYRVVEATAEQMNGNRYCTVAVETGNSSDRIHVTAIRGSARFPRSALTGSYTS